jgi:hypothetical protein
MEAGSCPRGGFNPEFLLRIYLTQLIYSRGRKLKRSIGDVNSYRMRESATSPGVRNFKQWEYRTKSFKKKYIKGARHRHEEVADPSNISFYLSL